jgi:hypothetical protein
VIAGPPRFAARLAGFQKPPPEERTVDISILEGIFAGMWHGLLSGYIRPNQRGRSVIRSRLPYPGILNQGSFQSIDGGIDTTVVDANSGRQIPVDVVQAMVAEGKVVLHEYLHSNMGAVPDMQRMGGEVARELLSDGVQAVIIGST